MRNREDKAMILSTTANDKNIKVDMDNERVKELEERLAKLELATKPKPSRAKALLVSAAQRTTTSATTTAKRAYSTASSCASVTVNLVAYYGRKFKPVLFSREAVELLMLGVTATSVVIVAQKQQKLEIECKKQIANQSQTLEQLRMQLIEQISENRKNIFLSYMNLYAPAKDILWLRNAANRDNAEANYILGLMRSGITERTGYYFDYTSGILHNYTLAIKHYQRAIELGSVNAQTALGNIYYFGKTYRKGRVSAISNDMVLTNHTKAIELYTKATEKDDAKAQYKLGLIYMNPPENMFPLNYVCCGNIAR